MALARVASRRRERYARAACAPCGSIARDLWEFRSRGCTCGRSTGSRARLCIRAVPDVGGAAARKLHTARRETHLMTRASSYSRHRQCVSLSYIVVALGYVSRSNNRERRSSFMFRSERAIPFHGGCIFNAVASSSGPRVSTVVADSLLDKRCGACWVEHCILASLQRARTRTQSLAASIR